MILLRLIFLDTYTYKGTDFEITNKLEIEIDTLALLFKTSFHSKHTYGGVGTCQLLRFHTVCTRIEDFKQATKLSVLLCNH